VVDPKTLPLAVTVSSKMTRLLHNELAKL